MCTGTDFQDVGNLGTVIHETARFLAKQYGLSKDAVRTTVVVLEVRL